jgi:hypothetical protein
MTGPAGAGTVTVDVPLADPDVALITAEPDDTAETTPVAETVATAVFALVHITDAPGITFPAALRTVAVSCDVAPILTVTAVGATVTDAAVGALTVTVEVPLADPDVAVMTAEPDDTAETTPVAETVATAVFALVHITDAPGITFPAALRTVAVSCDVAPILTVTVVGATVTDAAVGALTVTVEVPLADPDVAVMTAVPEDTADTTPVPETVATAVFPLLHVTAAPDITFPAASRTVAVSGDVPPILIVTVVGATVTEAVVGALTVTVAEPGTPSIVAVIETTPAATPVTTPAFETEAILVALLVHVTGLPVRL